MWEIFQNVKRKVEAALIKDKIKKEMNAALANAKTDEEKNAIRREYSQKANAEIAKLRSDPKYAKAKATKASSSKSGASGSKASGNKSGSSTSSGKKSGGSTSSGSNSRSTKGITIVSRNSNKSTATTTPDTTQQDSLQLSLDTIDSIRDKIDGMTDEEKAVAKQKIQTLIDRIKIMMGINTIEGR